MSLNCGDISNTINELRSKFDQCKSVVPADLKQLVELVAAVNSCAGGGDKYNTLIQEQYRGNAQDVEVVYPVNTYHAMSICVMQGSIVYGGFFFGEGATRNIEVTTLNQTETRFIVTGGSEVYVEYLKKTP